MRFGEKLHVNPPKVKAIFFLPLLVHQPWPNLAMSMHTLNSVWPFAVIAQEPNRTGVAVGINNRHGLTSTPAPNHSILASETRRQEGTLGSM